MTDLTEPVTEPGNCHRIAVAVEDLPAATRWFQDVLGATLLPVEEQAGGAVDAANDGGLLTLVWLKNVPIVPLTSTDPAGAIGRYLARNGPSVHSLAWEIPDMWRTENLLRADGMTIVGTDIPGRHFFVHPRHTLGLLLEYTDDKLPGDPRLGAPEPVGHGIVPVRSVAWVSAVVEDLAAGLGCLRYTFGARDATPASVGVGDTEEALDVRIGDMTVRLIVARSDRSLFAGSAGPGGGRFHSLALAVDDFAQLDPYPAKAGIRLLPGDGPARWADRRDTMGIQLQLVDAKALTPG
jgi:catechol 2,3-dioxygenase-like lactoylglutathione lyase family enzyme